MNMVRKSIVILLAILPLLLVCCSSTPTAESAPTSISLKAELAGEVWGQKFLVGLSGRSHLKGGMLFDFEETVTVPFGMKDTCIPLSIAFISEDKVILDIQDMEPLSEDISTPAEPYRYALEVNKGYFPENGIDVGDKVEFQEAELPCDVTMVFHKRT